uniref:Uncharacterized protein n=1 Tax=Globodera rostochiensis TaxID=31243 RepID=A0A914GSS4_GLORO
MFLTPSHTSLHGHIEYTFMECKEAVIMMLKKRQANYCITSKSRKKQILRGATTNPSKPQANNNPIESQPKIKAEPHEEQFDGKWHDESALKGIVKVEHEPHYGAVKVEGKDKIKHEFEFEWWGEENAVFKEQLEDRVKEEDQHGQAPNTSDHKKIGDDDENWSQDEDNSTPSADELDQNNSKEAKDLSDQNNSTDQNESVDEQQNNSTESNNNPIESQPKIKVEPHEEQFDGKLHDESALKGIVKVEHEPHYGAVKVEGTDKIKHEFEFEWWGEENAVFKEQLEDRVKEEDQHGQAPNSSDHKKIGDDDENWSQDDDNSAPSADDLDQDNSKKHLSDQNNSTDQDGRSGGHTYTASNYDYNANLSYTSNVPYSAHRTDSANLPYSAHRTDSTNLPYSAHRTDSAYRTDSTYLSDSPYTSDPAHTTYSTYSAHTTN